MWDPCGCGLYVESPVLHSILCPTYSRDHKYLYVHLAGTGQGLKRATEDQQAHPTEISLQVVLQDTRGCSVENMTRGDFPKQILGSPRTYQSVSRAPLSHLHS